MADRPRPPDPAQILKDAPTGQPVVGIADGWSGRATAGAAYANARGGALAVEAELGGLGAAYKIWSSKISGSIPFGPR